MAYPRLYIRDFSKGWNITDLPTELTSDVFFSSQTQGTANARAVEQPFFVETQFPALRNLHVTHKGRLTLRGGQRKIIPSQDAPLLGLSRYANETLRHLVYGASGHVYAFNEESADAPVIIGDVNGATSRVEFASIYDQLFWTDGTGLAKWGGTDPSHPLGLVAPVAALTSAAGAAGLLDSSATDSSPYQWLVTFVRSDGAESNPSPISVPLALTSQAADLSDIPVSADPSVTSRNIYRVGGTLTTYRLAFAISNNTATTATDNIADLSLGPNLLSFTHDPPPAGVSLLGVHKNRLVAAGDPAHPYRLYLSSYGQPDYWPTFINDPLNDGGFLDIPEPNFENPIVGLIGTGSVLLAPTRESFYVLLGETMNDFVIRKLCDVGCASGRTLTRCKSSVLFLSLDGMVYSLTEGEPEPVALPLERLLQGVAEEDLVNASATYQDQRFLLFVPQTGKPPVNVAFDFRTQSWTDLSDPLLAASGCFSSPNSSLRGDTLIATAPGYLDEDGAAYNGILSVLDASVTGASLDFDFETPDFEMGRPSYTKRAKWVRIEGEMAPGNGVAPLLTVTAASPGRADVVRQYPLLPSGAGGLLLDAEMSPLLCGKRISLALAGSVQALEVNSIDMAFQFIREAA